MARCARWEQTQATTACTAARAARFSGVGTKRVRFNAKLRLPDSWPGKNARLKTLSRGSPGWGTLAIQKARNCGEKSRFSDPCNSAHYSENRGGRKAH